MTSSIQTTLDIRPKTFDGVHMNDASSILFSGMVNDLVSITNLSDLVIASEFICKDLATVFSMCPDQREKSSSLNIWDYFGVELPFTFNHSKYRRLFFSRTTLLVTFATNIGFISFDNTGHFTFFIHQEPDLGEHPPCCFIGDSEFPLKLFGGYPTASRSHKKESVKPTSQGCAGMVENGVGGGRYLPTAKLTAVSLSSANPVILSYLLAFGTKHAIGIFSMKEEIQAYIVIWKLGIKIFQGVFCGLYFLSHFDLQFLLSKVSIAHKVRVVKGYLRVTLEDFGDKELLDEIAKRIKRLGSEKTTFFPIAAPVCTILKALNCPDEILNPVIEWAKSPIVDVNKLAEWERLCGVKRN